MTTAAFEVLLLCSGLAHPTEQWQHDNNCRLAIVDRLRPRLGISRRMHNWLIDRLNAVPLPTLAASTLAGSTLGLAGSTRRSHGKRRRTETP